MSLFSTNFTFADKKQYECKNEYIRQVVTSVAGIVIYDIQLAASRNV